MGLGSGSGKTYFGSRGQKGAGARIRNTCFKVILQNSDARALTCIIQCSTSKIVHIQYQVYRTLLANHKILRVVSCTYM
jgi:hypothetical protein